MRNRSVARTEEAEEKREREEFAENFFASSVNFLPARYAIRTRTGERT